MAGSSADSVTTHYPTPQQAASTPRGFHPPTPAQQSPRRVSPHRAHSPSNAGYMSPVYDPALFGLPRPEQTTLTASFVDMLANDFGFGDSDQDFRAGLHSFAQVSSMISNGLNWLTNMKMGKDLSKSDLATRTYSLGILFQIMRDLRSHAESLQHFEVMLMDVSARLEDTFSLTLEQRVCSPSCFRSPLLNGLQSNIRHIAWEVIFEPKRVSYMQIHLDVEVIVVYFMQSHY